jgi:arginyl-tRNA--protein-N-Asp/Glu arginylyltransferase
MYNIQNNLSLEENYQQGLLPQRNSKTSFYQDDNFSSRCNLESFQLSSENRRILKKTENYSFQKIPLSEFNYTTLVQKQIVNWVKKLGWEFPVSSIKTVFTNHIFNYLYIWRDQNNNICAYSLCYIGRDFSHIAYVFYDPTLAHNDLPIRLSLQVIVDSDKLKHKYCYLGRFNPETKLGYYKRNFPGFQYFTQGQWLSYNQ